MSQACFGKYKPGLKLAPSLKLVPGLKLARAKMVPKRRSYTLQLKLKTVVVAKMKSKEASRHISFEPSSKVHNTSPQYKPAWPQLEACMVSYKSLVISALL